MKNCSKILELYIEEGRNAPGVRAHLQNCRDCSSLIGESEALFAQEKETADYELPLSVRREVLKTVPRHILLKPAGLLDLFTIASVFILILSNSAALGNLLSMIGSVLADTGDISAVFTGHGIFTIPFAVILAGSAGRVIMELMD